jgi:methylated-DNA-[protein]-cysteine S-methyltransferase
MKITTTPTLYTRIASALGEVLLTSRDGKLSGLYFADQPHARLASDWVREDALPVFAQTARELAEYASGARKRFSLTALGLAGTAAQMNVWMEILAIPYGRTISYSDLAQRVGSPEAVRAVGGAAGRNPLCWIVPCHRVVGKNGSLTGYAGGIERKSALLDFEAARLRGEEAILALREPSLPALA